MTANRRERLTRTPIAALVRTLFLASLVGAVAAPGMASAQSATPGPASYGGTPSTAIVVTATNDPLAVLGSDGMRHLDYDLIVTNTFLAPVRLSHIDVLAPDGTRLQRLEGDALLAATQPILGATPQQEIPASGTVAVVMDVVVDPDLAVAALNHVVAYDVPPDARDQALIASRETAGPVLPLANRAAVAIAPPLAGDGWLALNGCCAAASVHRFERVAAGGTSIVKAEMFAIDWVQLRDGQLNSRDGSRAEDYFSFGAEVRAAADGTVVYARDGMPEQPLGTVTGLSLPEDFGGNQVMVEISPGIYAWYAHLQTGSVAVALGDRVLAGQPIGRLGNSGNSTSPHLHFGLLDAPNSLTGNGVPMVIDRYELAGTVDPVVLTSATPPPDGRFPIDTSAASAQTATLPLYLTVANFP